MVLGENDHLSTLSWLPAEMSLRRHMHACMHAYKVYRSIGTYVYNTYQERKRTSGTLIIL